MIEVILVFESIIFGLFGVVATEHEKIYRDAYEFWLANIVFARKDHHLNNPATCQLNLNRGFFIKADKKSGCWLIHKFFFRKGQNLNNLGKYNPELYNPELCNPEIYNPDKNPYKPLKEKTEQCNKNICSTVESLSRQINRINDIYLINYVALYLITTLTFVGVIWNLTTTYRVHLVELNISNLNQSQDFTDNIIVLFLTIIMIFGVYYMSKFDNFLEKSSSMDEKLFEVWWKYKCHRHKDKDFQGKKEPKRLYEKLAEDIYKGEVRDAYPDEELLVRDLTGDLSFLFRP